MLYLENRFKRQVKAVGVTGSTVTVNDIPCKANENRVYTRVSVEDETNGNVTWRLGVRRFGQFYDIAQLATSNQNDIGVYDDEIILTTDDESLEVRVTGSTDSDVLAVYFYGYSVYDN